MFKITSQLCEAFNCNNQQLEEINNEIALKFMSFIKN